MQHNKMIRTMVVLADSYKHGAHCIAGKCINTRQWIRPVSTPQGGQISSHQARSRNPYGIYPVKPLQKIRMAFTDAVPLINRKRSPRYLDLPCLKKHVQFIDQKRSGTVSSQRLT
ncbi:dual OB domain-containing protein [Vibrio metschnikovii]|uniref:dual OB domain-containing protein n=1 Tax=Vibrio metschnikovii TaxID=28172 RepID=UPI002A289649|nr:hypothetical protein [Vibrio metschnikovii]